MCSTVKPISEVLYYEGISIIQAGRAIWYGSMKLLLSKTNGLGHAPDALEPRDLIASCLVCFPVNLCIFHVSANKRLAPHRTSIVQIMV